MNTMVMQQVFGVAVAARERARVVSISNPEYQELTPSQMLLIVLFFVVCILIIAGIIVGIVMLYRHFKGKGVGASGAAGRMPSVSRPAQAAATATRYCTSCGASIPRVSRFCPKCGANQGQRQKQGLSTKEAAI